MSADDGSSQTPTGGTDKAQAPATFSSFINKNTTGKKFAPKAARRRPGAAAAAATAVSAPKPAAQPVQSSQAEPQSSNVSVAAPAPSTQLPTPAPTQDPATQEPTTQHVSKATPTPVEPINGPPATTAPTLTSPPPPPPTEQTQPAQQPHHAPRTSPQPAAPPQPVEDDIEAGRPPKRRRIESPSRQSTPAVPVAVMVPPQHLDTIASDAGEASTTTDATPSTEADGSTRQSRRKTLPWTAVNHSLEDGGEVEEAPVPPAKKKRAPPKPRGKKAAPDTTPTDEEGEQQHDEEEAQPTQAGPSARARGKRRADAVDVGEDGGAVEAPAKKLRKPRKDKGKQRAESGEGIEGETEQGEDVAAKPKRKPRAPKRKTATPAGEDGEEGSQEPKRRGRPPREDTPSDAEDRTIDPDMMFMDDLASRNIRVGKLSRREREMRKIDWDAVKARRREEDARHISTKETQAVVDKLLESGEVEAAPTGPRYHVVDGRIELIQDSGTIDRERDADREIDAMLITEEDDLTTRITSRSFMKNNKRFPNEFVLPGQGKKWNPQSTDLFYQGLRSFGTDFQMIAHMFPGMTRRSIKTKFTREERENPDLVRDCLRGESQLESHWSHFLAASQLQETSFADADLIKRELLEEETRMRVQINEALKEKQEREKQKLLAGLADENNPEAGGGDKEKGKRKRKGGKEKNVAFVEEGVEVLGALDEDPNWGVE